MSKHTEALKLALEALKQIDEAMPFPVAKLAQKVIREALAEQPALYATTIGEGHMAENGFEGRRAEQSAQQQEPESFEAWNAKQHGDPEEIGFLQALRIAYISGQDSVHRTSPPASKPWVGLTQEERLQFLNQLLEYGTGFVAPLDAVLCNVEAKLREKNA